MPFLENVTRGRNVPRERLEEVAHHYKRFGGVSPINAQNRELIDALERELRRARHRPARLLRQPELAPAPHGHGRADDAGRRAPRARLPHVGVLELLRLPPVPREPLRRAGGGGPEAPGAPRLRMPFNHPGLHRGERRPAASGAVGREARGAHVAFTAHSIPVAMAERCALRAQLAETRAARRRGGRRRDARGRLPEPERAAAGALARAGRPRPSARLARARGGRCGRRPARVRLRSHRGAVRPRPSRRPRLGEPSSALGSWRAGTARNTSRASSRRSAS